MAVELAGDARAPQAMDVPLDVVGDGERERRREAVRKAGEVEEHDRRVLVNRRRGVGDVRERAGLTVGAEPQQQGLELVRVGAGQLAVQLALAQRVDEQLLSRTLAALCTSCVRGGDRVAQQRLLVGVERAHEALGVVRLTDEQRVERQEELELLVGHVLDVGHVPRADHRAVGRAELDPPSTWDQR